MAVNSGASFLWYQADMIRLGSSVTYCSSPARASALIVMDTNTTP